MLICLNEILIYHNSYYYEKTFLLVIKSYSGLKHSLPRRKCMPCCQAFYVAIHCMLSANNPLTLLLLLEKKNFVSLPKNCHQFILKLVRIVYTFHQVHCSPEADKISLCSRNLGRHLRRN